MKSYLECIPCFFKQALRAGRIATDDEKILKRLMDELGTHLPRISLESTPPETGRLIYRMVAEITGNPDPYRELKREATEQALARYPRLKRTIEDSDDPLLAAIRLAIAGNVIDFGANASYDMDKAIREALEKDFAILDYDAFKSRLKRSGKILYLGDNAGETVFDRLLIEQIDRPMTYVVRDKPVINDATYADGVAAGIDRIATIVSSGTDAPGTILATCSPEFRQMLQNCGLVIAKGQGNYEGLSGEKREIFFLLKAKCPVIADNIGVETGAIILKGINLN